MRGIRDFDSAGRLTDSRFLHGFRLLGKYDLIASMNVTWSRWTPFDRWPTVIPTFGWLSTTPAPVGARPRLPRKVEAWHGDRRWGRQRVVQDIGTRHDRSRLDGRLDQAFVLYCIETFGTERSFFGTNWPVDSLWSGYADVVDAYTEIISGFSAEERKRLFVKNAEKLYRI